MDSKQVDWEQRYRDQAIPWDKGYAAPILTQLLNEHSLLFQGVNRALVPGCGFGYDALALAEHGIQTIGFDISQSAIAEAKQRFPHEKVQWIVGDLFADLESDSFDMVWEHTCFCAIPPSTREAYVKAIANTLKPGGFLLGVFFIETELPENEGPPFKATIEKIKTYFSDPFRLDFELSPTVSYQGRENCEHVMLFRKGSSDIPSKENGDPQVTEQ
jgi:methyl halide transferase